jgi:hypothetical protein
MLYRVAMSGEPLRGYRDRVLDERQRQYETLILRLSKDGERVDMFMVGMICADVGMIYADEREP